MRSRSEMHNNEPSLVTTFLYGLSHCGVVNVNADGLMMQVNCSNISLRYINNVMSILTPTGFLNGRVMADQS